MARKARRSTGNGVVRDAAIGVAVASGAVLAVAGVAWALWPKARPAIVAAIIVSPIPPIP